MIRDGRNLSPEFIETYCKEFESTNDFYGMLNKYKDLEHNELFQILYTKYKYKYLKEFLASVEINEDKLIIISDTHYGAIYENLLYIDQVFDFAKANSIKTILHNGDVLQGKEDLKYKYYKPKSQVEHFIKDYPFDENIKTYALLGNHDFSALNKNHDLRIEMDSRSDIDILGYKKEYVSFSGYLIGLHHEIERYKMRYPFKKEIIEFRGHSHKYEYKELDNYYATRFYVPCLCDKLFTDTYGFDLPYSKPGFLQLIIDDQNLIVQCYLFNNINPVLYEEKVIELNDYFKASTRVR